MPLLTAFLQSQMQHFRSTIFSQKLDTQLNTATRGILRHSPVCFQSQSNKEPREKLERCWTNQPKCMQMAVTALRNQTRVWTHTFSFTSGAKGEVGSGGNCDGAKSNVSLSSLLCLIGLARESRCRCVKAEMQWQTILVHIADECIKET